MSVYMKSAKKVGVASLFLSLEDPGYDPGVGWLSSSSWGLAEAVLVTVWQVTVFPSRCSSKY